MRRAGFVLMPRLGRGLLAARLEGSALAYRMCVRHRPSLVVPLGAALGMALGAVVPLPLGGRQQQHLESGEGDDAAILAQVGRMYLLDDVHSIEEALRQLQLLLEADPQARARQLCAMAEAIAEGAASGSEAQQALLDCAVAAGVPPSTALMHTMLTQLQAECRPAPLLEDFTARLAALGVEPDDETASLMGRSARELAPARTSELQRLLGPDPRVSEPGKLARRDAAVAIFGRMLEAGEASGRHLTVMLRHGCEEGSGAQLALLARAATAGVPISVRHCTVILSRLQLEGRTVPTASDRTRGALMRVDERG